VQPLLVFDGECGFCTATAAWVSRRWRIPARSVAWQAFEPGELAELGLTEDDVRSYAWWIDAEGRRFRGHFAVAHSLAASSGWRGLAGRILLVPPFRWLGAPVYSLVARNRGRLPGSTPACRKRDSV
jgi:predicted DCC family thiol-disulfide oxidoreductase YuxK